jgi:hypothetical protein
MPKDRCTLPALAGVAAPPTRSSARAAVAAQMAKRDFRSRAMNLFIFTPFATAAFGGIPVSAVAPLS